MSGNIFIHQTQPLYIPEDAGVARDVLQGVNPEQVPNIGEEDLVRCDTRTLFYDMFFESGDLILLGPPLLNLGLPLSIWHQGRKLRFRNETTPIWRAPSILRLKLKLPPEQEQLDLEFRFRDFSISASCQAPQARPPQLSRKEASLVTLQKDNPVEWLRDWLLWHHRVHGIQRAVIYDNGSEYFSELLDLLAGLDEGMEIILVPWPFPYGSGTLSLINARYCQAGALNHFRMLFGDSVRWGLNLDVDEYLYQPDAGGPALMQYLMEPEVASEPTVCLGSWLFPADAGHRREGALPRFFHHRMRYCEERRPFRDGPKYMFQLRRIRVCKTHKAYYIPAWTSMHWLSRMLLLAWENIRTRPLSRLLDHVTDHRRTSKGYAWRDSLNTRTFLFLHFRGLYTGWRSSRVEKTRDLRMKQRIAAARAENGEISLEDVGELYTETIPPDWLTEEPDVMKTAARVGLAPSADHPALGRKAPAAGEAPEI